MPNYKSREEVPLEEKWDLHDIYDSLTTWESDLKSVAERTEQLKTYDGNITDAKSLYDYLVLSEETGYTYKKVYVYAMLQADLDTRDSKPQALLDRAKSLGVKLSSATSFFMPFLLSLDEKTLKSYIDQIEGLKYFEEDLMESYRYKTHVLTKEKEEVLSDLGEALSSPSNTFGMINNADIKFGKVTTKDGEKVELTRGMYSKLIEDDNRDVRREAYKAYYQPYVQLNNTIASTLSAAIKNNVTLAKMRKYPSALEKSLFSDMVPKDVYDNLIKVTKDHITPLHKYQNIRKETLGLDELRQYDLNVPLVKDVKEEITFDEAYQTMLDSLAPLGEEYVETLRSFKEKRYFDVRETPGKRSGAYNLGLYGVHPFVLLNHQDDLDSLFTLVHECGHAMHSWYSSNHQPQITAGYSIFVAEVASTVNEVLLIRYLLKTTKDEKMKKHLLNHFIDSFRGTMFTQVMFAEFEKTTHEKAENGGPLNAEVFNDVYEKIFREFNGNEMVFDDEVKYGWSRIPHFYRPFYVYKYATGYAAAIHIADQLLEGKSETLEKYMTFLKSGSSDYPLELLKAAGVDLTKPEPIRSALTIFSELVDEFASL
ncbi:oligoendopeptidase F [Halalkalibacter wakoensis JCM 9140]|uniref:Oligopeptidase F n=1 Tax=Halalkalibacter wakoensis JCM 9140 TaxID=1236970 RepID=W4Q8Z8_9BACI|nr:oligoendopeptidase F [Halalkalibacter wakoensis]GAE28460.1 oligoendopeptidase F [Halalkalibacter wakoensis JCM 9140]